MIDPSELKVGDFITSIYNYESRYEIKYLESCFIVARRVDIEVKDSALITPSVFSSYDKIEPPIVSKIPLFRSKFGFLSGHYTVGAKEYELRITEEKGKEPFVELIPVAG